jgi:hypothetical protein
MDRTLEPDRFTEWLGTVLDGIHNLSISTCRMLGVLRVSTVGTFH